MTARSDAAELQGLIDARALAAVRAHGTAYDWRVVSEVLSPRSEGRGGTATVVDARGNTSYGVRWFERRPTVGDTVLVEIPPPGGTRRIVAIDREITDAPPNLPIYSAADFGARGDGSTDDTSALNEALATIGAAGGGVLMGVAGGTHVVNSGLVLNRSMVRFDLNGGTLLRTGASTDAVIWIRTEDLALDKIVRSGVSNGTIDGGGVALYGVRVTTANFSPIEQLTIQGCTTWQLYMDCWDTRPAGGNARDNQHNALRDLKLVCTGSQGGMRLHGNSDAAIVAGDGANTSLNRIDNIWVSLVDGDAFSFGNTDGNAVTHLRTSSATGRGLVLNGSTLAAGGHARDNVFTSVQVANAGTYALAGTTPSADNVIFGNNLGNGGTDPDIAAGASLPYINQDGTGNIAPVTGIWTPTVSFGTPGDLNVVYSAQEGNYVKIGRLVQCWGSLVTSTFTHTTAAGNFLLKGLPFTAATTTGEAGGGEIMVRYTSATLTHLKLIVVSNSLNCTVLGVGTGVTPATLTVTQVPSGTQLATTRFSFSYLAAS